MNIQKLTTLIKPNATRVANKIKNMSIPRELTSDVVELGNIKKAAASKQTESALLTAAVSSPDVNLKKHLTELGEKNLFNNEILAFLTRTRTPEGELSFNSLQRDVISAAVKKVNRLRTIAHKLADDGRRAEKDAVDEMKEIFGNKYKNCFEHRAKSKESTFDKLVNNLRDDVNKFRNEFYKKEFGLDYKKCTDEQKDIVLQKIIDGDVNLSSDQWKKLVKVFDKTKTEARDAKAVVMDQVGTRLLLPKGSKAETDEVTELIEKAIKAQKIRVTRVSNYSCDGIKAYVSNNRIAGWQELDHRIPALVNYDKKKDNGYTTFQMNVIHRNGIPGEFQLRSRRMNIVCNGEHTFYDYLENKNISKDVPELQEYYEKSGVIDLVQDLKRNKVSMIGYKTYIKDSYKKTRDTALGAEYPMPVITNYVDKKYQKLSLENLCKIAEDVHEIQKKYPQIFG